MLDINKCIWITGASTGIGKDLALKLASEGFTVAASARSLINLKKLKDESKILKGSIEIYPLDNSFFRKNDCLYLKPSRMVSVREHIYY